MSGNHFDLIVIGTGPAGEGAAMKAAKAGKHVAVMEQFAQVGGGSTHWGTIPSKALRRAINYLNITYQNPLYHRMEIVPTYSFPDLLASAEQVITQQTEMRLGFYEHNGVRLLHGHARFADLHTIELLKTDGAAETFTADAFVIATGSRPYRPKDVDFSHPRIFDSDKLLTMDFTPRSVTIYGAGVVGCEYASMLARMKMEVTLVNTRDKLLAFLDDEIIAALTYHFSDEEGILMRHGEEYERIEGLEATKGEGGVVLHLKSGKQIRSDILLWANGRSGNTEDLGLEKLGVVPNKRGSLEVNEKLQVKINASDGATQGAGKVHEHIYAAGDVIGEPSLASASYDQGRFAATELAEGRAEYKLLAAVPTGIYTTPEISSLGKTEEQLTADKVPYEVGKSYFKHLARAQIRGQQVGMLKLLFHRQTLALLGIHCFGENASEIIHIGQAILTQPAPHNTIWYFVHTTFNYPTMAEAYRVAALNGLDRVDEATKRKSEVDGQKA